MPLVSVIVPVYKAEKWLRRCVDSILAQTMEDFELLLIDDGSPDRSGEICDEYAAKDLRVRVFHKENGGVSSARNLGLDNALGAYIMFVDSDDWVGCDYIKDIYDKRDGDTLLIQGIQFVRYDGSFYIDNFKTKIYISEQLEDFFSHPLYGYPVAKLYNRGVIEYHNIRFDEKLSLYEDNIFMLDYLLVVQCVKFISGVNYFYFCVPGSLSRTYHSFDECYLYYLKLCLLLEKFNSCFDVLHNSYLNRVLAETYMKCFVNLYYTQVNFRERVKYFKYYRTEKEVLRVRKYLKANSIKQRISILLFGYNWFLFDVYRLIGIYIKHYFH